MKLSVFLMMSLTVFAARAQTTGTRTATVPPAGAQTAVTAPNAAVAIPNNQNLNLNPALNLQNPTVAQALSNAANRLGVTNPFESSTNAAGGNLGLTDLQSQLLNLQVNIEQTLPALISLSGGQINPRQGALNPALNPGAAAQTGTLPATGAVTPRQLANGSIVGGVGTNSFAMNPQTFRALRTLTFELEQALPLLESLNGGVATGLNPATGAGAAGFTNLFAPLGAGGQISPTGR